MWPGESEVCRDEGDLRPYDPADTEVLVPFVTAFWAVHHTRVDADEARQELADWSSGRHRLYVIEADGTSAGFLHLNRRGPIAARVEHLGGLDFRVKQC